MIAKDKREFSTIDVDDGISLLADSIQSSIPSNPFTLCSIYRVPDNLKKGYEEKYEPNVVSIGPYHCTKQNLKITEKNKLWYLGKFISRRTPPQTSLNDMVKAVKNLEEKARDCYAEEIHLSSDDFIKMMVIDGCFILELLYRKKIGHSEEDLIYSAPWLIETVKQDLVLLENQLPFIILECLHHLNEHYDLCLRSMVSCFFKSWFTVSLYERISKAEGSNILELLRNGITGDFHLNAFPASVVDHQSIPCAKDLLDMGVKLRTADEDINVLHVIHEEGWLTIPCLPKGIIYYLFPNSIALEQCHSHFKGYITSYILLLGQLFNSKDDVKFLRNVGNFEGNENDDEKFVTEISGLCQRAKPIEYHYYDLYYSVWQYTRSGWNRRRANLHNWNVILKRDYFGTPWAVISFIAAVTLVVLTAIQAVYAIRSCSPK